MKITLTSQDEYDTLLTLVLRGLSVGVAPTDAQWLALSEWGSGICSREGHVPAPEHALRAYHPNLRGFARMFCIRCWSRHAPEEMN